MLLCPEYLDRLRNHSHQLLLVYLESSDAHVTATRGSRVASLLGGCSDASRSRIPIKIDYEKSDMRAKKTL